MKLTFLFFLFYSLSIISCSAKGIILGAEQTDKYINKIQNKKVAVVSNQSSNIGTTHLVDSLLSINIDIVKIFSPEHGFRGDADAGEKITNYIDPITKIPVVSLYGKNYKPAKKDLSLTDVVVFDLQDVGVRFYTYISTLHYVMEACAENNIEVIVLDRPNPNGQYVDGPVLDTSFRSFVGMHPVALVHGMTIGEYAKMINGERWLKNGIQCKLTVVPCDNYTHLSEYILPVKPSPNLPNQLAIKLYPTLGLFEGTVISCGRGTDYPFQIIGNPKFKNMPYSFTPRSIPGASKYPRYQGEICNGLNFTTDSLSISISDNMLNVNLLIYMYNNYPNKSEFFNSFFKKLAGTDKLQKQIVEGLTEAEIRQSWQAELDKFKILRSKYLIYK